MTDRFESILDESISALQAGVSIEEILAETPDFAAELRPLLYAAAVLTDPNPVLAPEERKTILRAEYMRQVAGLPALPPPSLAEKAQALLRIVRRRFTRGAFLSDLATVAVTVTLTLLMSIALLTYLAGDTLPSDWLYGIKRISENAQLYLAVSPEYRADLEQQFNDRRLDEIRRLMAANRAALIQFKGRVETRGAGVWIIEGYPVVVPADALISGDPQQGDPVEVIGLIRTNGVMVADTLRKVTQ